MRTIVLSVHAGLAENSRVPVLTRPGQDVRVREMLLLLCAGATAALATALTDFGLRIPGNAIIRAVFPMAFGLAIVPRRMAGATMGVGALATAVTINSVGFARLGMGALTSLTLIGPLLDLALWRARNGWRLYLGFGVAGLAGNLAAMAVRGGIKLVGLDHAAGRPLAAWWQQAAVSYAVCGVLAGVISAMVWFQFAAGRGTASPGERSA